MMTALLFAVATLLGWQVPAQELDPLKFDPHELPVAEAGRWDGLFDGNSIVGGLLPQELAPISERGQAAYARRDFPAAIAANIEQLELAPDFPPSLLELGTIYFRLRRYGDCIVCLERFISVAPSQAWRTQVLAHAYYSLGRYEEARQQYEKVIAVIPTSVEAIRGLALSLYRMGDSRLALEMLERVFQLNPDHVEALMWKAQILYEEERSEEALEVAEHARSLEPFNPRPQYLLWQIHLDLGQDEEAENAHRQWKELDRVAQEVRSLEGQLLFRPHEYGLALRLANLQEQVGNAAGVRRAFAIAVRNRPDDVSEVELRSHVLDVLVDLGDKAGAASAAEDLGRHCSQEPSAWKRLESYYGRIGQTGLQVKAGELFLRLSRGQ